MLISLFLQDTLNFITFLFLVIPLIAFLIDLISGVFRLFIR